MTFNYFELLTVKWHSSGAVVLNLFQVLRKAVTVAWPHCHLLDILLNYFTFNPTHSQNEGRLKNKITLWNNHQMYFTKIYHSVLDTYIRACEPRLFCFIYLHSSVPWAEQIVVKDMFQTRIFKRRTIFTQFAIRLQRYAEFTPFSFFCDQLSA